MYHKSIYSDTVINTDVKSCTHFSGVDWRLLRLDKISCNLGSKLAFFIITLACNINGSIIILYLVTNTHASQKFDKYQILILWIYFLVVED